MNAPVTDWILINGEWVGLDGWSTWDGLIRPGPLNGGTINAGQAILSGEDCLSCFPLGLDPMQIVQNVIAGNYWGAVQPFCPPGYGPTCGGINPFMDAGPANNATNVSCNSTTGICVPSSMVNGPSNWQRLKNGVKWYLCGNGSFDNIKNYTLEGLTKGVIVGGIAGWEGGPLGVGLGALGGGVEGFFSGNAVGWVATAGCQAAGMYPPAS